MRRLQNILVTGGAGFIGCNFIRFMLEKADFRGRIINFDLLTYAGNIANLDDIKEKYGAAGAESGAAEGGGEGGAGRYYFVHGDINDTQLVTDTFKRYDIDTVVHFAAESHVDRSITGPKTFIETNVLGTFTLLDAARCCWVQAGGCIRDDVLFHHISTDEVYGSLDKTGFFKEETPYAPRSPYSASKAGSDFLVQAYHHTYGLPITISNCSNNYGPYQFPEKLIPLMILNILQGKALPVYGDGKNIRDWIYVEDHNRAVWQVMQHGKTGEKYNIGGENEWENIKLVNTLIEIVCTKTGRELAAAKETISFVPDRLGHDRRYAIDCSKIKRELGWKQEVSFREGLERTVDWYLAKGR